MINQLILHIGPEKTGTTAIQSLLSQHRNGILARGVFAPESIGGTPTQHLSVLREILGRGEFDAIFPFTPEALDLQSVLTCAESANCSSILLSAEGFSRPEVSEGVLELVTRVAPKSLIVVVALREPVAWLRSLHAQRVIDFDPAGGTLDFPKFVETQGIQLWEQLPATLRRLARGVSSMDVRVIDVNDGKAGQTFFKELGMSYSFREPLLNVSQNPNIVSFKLLLNQKIAELGLSVKDAINLRQRLIQDVDALDSEASDSDYLCDIPPTLRIDVIQHRFDAFVNALEEFGVNHQALRQVRESTKMSPKQMIAASSNQLLSLVISKLLTSIHSQYVDYTKELRYWMSESQKWEKEVQYWMSESQKWEKEVQYWMSESQKWEK